MATDIPPVLGVTPASLTGGCLWELPLSYARLLFQQLFCKQTLWAHLSLARVERHDATLPPFQDCGTQWEPRPSVQSSHEPRSAPPTPPEALSSLASRGPLLQAPFLNPTTLHLHSVPPVPWLTSEGYVQPLRSPAKPTHSHPQLIYCLLTTSTEPLARPQFRTSGFHCPRQVPLEPQNQHVPKC